MWLTAPYALRQHDRDFGHDWNPANKDSGNQKRHSMPRTHQKLGGPQREAATNCLSMDMGISWGCLFGPVAHTVMGRTRLVLSQWRATSTAPVTQTTTVTLKSLCAHSGLVLLRYPQLTWF